MRFWHPEICPQHREALLAAKMKLRKLKDGSAGLELGFLKGVFGGCCGCIRTAACTNLSICLSVRPSVRLSVYADGVEGVRIWAEFFEVYINVLFVECF